MGDLTDRMNAQFDARLAAGVTSDWPAPVRDERRLARATLADAIRANDLKADEIERVLRDMGFQARVLPRV